MFKIAALFCSEGSLGESIIGSLPNRYQLMNPSQSAWVTAGKRQDEMKPMKWTSGVYGPDIQKNLGEEAGLLGLKSRVKAGLSLPSA